MTLRGVFFLDAKRGWIVGDKGTCLATVDGGARWEKIETGSDATLRGVRFNDANHGFICGDGDRAAPPATGHIVMQRPMRAGSLLATEDGGRTWRKTWVPCNFEVWCVETSAAPVLQVGVGCEEHLDGDVTRSSDSGRTWQERRVFRALSDIRAMDAQRWIAVGSPVSVGFTGTINDPAYVAKGCRALFSKDGGKTWTPSKGSDGSGCLRGLLAKKGRLALAVGDDGALIGSEDEGETWKEIKSPEPLGLRAITATAGGKEVVAVGEYGRFIVSADGGTNWRASWIGQPQRLYAVAECGGIIWAVGANGCAVYCDARALAAARILPTAPEPPRAEEKRAKKATAAQRARVRVGDYCLYVLRMQSPALGLNTECQIKLAVTLVNGDEFTLRTEITQGPPPPGMPQKGEDKGQIADLDAFSDYEPGKRKEEKQGQQTLTTVREPDEAVTVKQKKLTCMIIKTEGDLPNGLGRVSTKQWLCTAEIPLAGLVKLECEQTMAMPNGAQAKVSNTQELIEWGRGK